MASEDQIAKSPPTKIEDAVEAGIEAAAEYVSSLPSGQKYWAMKEYKIAETAAREAIAALRQAAAGDSRSTTTGPTLGYYMNSLKAWSQEIKRDLRIGDRRMETLDRIGSSCAEDHRAAMAARREMLAVVERHMTEAVARRDAALATGNMTAALVAARQAQTADEIGREIDGVSNDR
jgi:hypothetical protein